MWILIFFNLNIWLVVINSAYGEWPEYKKCFCDQICSIFDDCCSDTKCGLKLRSQKWIIDISKHGSCLPTYLKEYHVKDSNIWHVSKCPNDYVSKFIKNQCEGDENGSTLTSIWPVTSSRTGITYRNIYCSICWADNFGLLKWKLSVECYNDNRIRSFQDCFKHYATAIKYFVPPCNDCLNERSCTRTLITQCSKLRSHTDDLEHLCRNSTDLFCNNDIYYKNKFCAECNEAKLEENSCSNDYLLGINIKQYHIPNPISILFDINTGTISKDNGKANGLRTKEPIRCEEYEILDVTSQTCKPSLCSSEYKFNGTICVPKNGTCNDVTFDLEKVRINSNGILFLIPYNETYEPLTYFVTSTKVILCLDKNHEVFFKEVPNTYLVDKSGMPAIVSSVLTVLSMLSLLLHFMCYCLLPNLRNRTGIFIMLLDLSLLSAQGSLLITGYIEKTSLCIPFAVLVHFLYLCSFSWMCSIAVDFTLNVSTISLMSFDQKPSWCLIIRYIFTYTAVPFLIVISAFITDRHLDINHVLHPRYGKPVCWFNNGSALILFFLGPIALIQIIITILFVSTLIRIRKISLKTHAVGKKRNYVIIYSKLSVLMGCTWIFGYIWLLGQNIVFEYLFIIFNSLQGTFIFIAFISRRQVLVMVSRRLAGRRDFARVSSATPGVNNSTRHSLLKSRDVMSDKEKDSENVNENIELEREHLNCTGRSA